MSIVTVRRAAFSLVVLLSRTPAPHERIGSLILGATLAVELHCTLDDLARTSFRVGDAEAVADGPFGNAALASSLTGSAAAELVGALAGSGTGPLLRVEARRIDGLNRRWEVPLAEVLAGGVDDISACVRLVTADGGTVTDVPPVVAGRTRDLAATGGTLMLRHGVLRPVASLVRPHPAVLATLVASESLLLVPLAPVVSGPGLEASPLLGDRDGTSHWYLPELTLLVPPAGQDPDTSPFRYDLATVGHQDDGSPGLEATVTVTLAAGPSGATTAAWEAAGRPAMKPLDCTPTVGLRIPFRDAQGRAASEVIPATGTSVAGVLGEAGSTLTATFVVQDRWARLAYGVLSYPGYQAQAPTVEVGLTHSGWRESRRFQIDPALIAGGKLLALRRGDDATRAVAPTQVLGMAKARIQLHPPVLQAEPLGVTQWRQVTATAAASVPTVLPCADHGQLYRQQGAAGWEAIGCQDTLRLGQADHRVWQPEPVATADVTVFRSLTQPGRYLVVPAAYAVGRHPADDHDRALRPTLLLTSTIDVDDPSGIRCVLAAALQADLNPARWAMLGAELRAKAGRDVVLLTPWQAALTPTVSWAIPGADDLDCVAVDDGFTLVLSTDIPGLLTLRAMLQRGGFLGSARWQLPGGDLAVATLRLDLGRVVGPAEGPVTVTRTVDEARLTNLLGSRVAVRRLTADGTVVASPGLVLEAHGSATVALPAGTVGELAVDHEVEAGTETLDESRSYIDDLELAVTFVATGDLTQVAGIEISCTLLGDAPAPLTLTRSTRQGERQFLMPLTRYAEDPTLRFTATAVAADGTRTAAPAVDWPLRSRGVLIPIDTPTPA